MWNWGNALFTPSLLHEMVPPPLSTISMAPSTVCINIMRRIRGRNLGRRHCTINNSKKIIHSSPIGSQRTRSSRVGRERIRSSVQIGCIRSGSRGRRRSRRSGGRSSRKRTRWRGCSHSIIVIRNSNSHESLSLGHSGRLHNRCKGYNLLTMGVRNHSMQTELMSFISLLRERKRNKRLWEKKSLKSKAIPSSQTSTPQFPQPGCLMRPKRF